MNCLEKSTHPEDASKCFWCLIISLFLLTAATGSMNANSTCHYCFLRLDATLPRCTCSVLSGSCQQCCHHLSIPYDMPHMHPPCLSKPAFWLQAVHIILSLPLISNTNSIILKPTLDGQSPHSNQILVLVSTSCQVCTCLLGVEDKGNYGFHSSLPICHGTFQLDGRRYLS